MQFSLLLTSIGGMGVMIGVGWFISRFVAFTADMKRLLIFLLVNVALPCLIFSGISQLEFDRTLMLQVLAIIGISLLLHIAAIFVLWPIGKALWRTESTAREIAVLSTLGNTGIIGIPLSATLFGPKGALFAAVFDVGMAVTLWTIAIVFLKQGERFRFSQLKVMLNMPICAIIVGLTLALSGLHPPEFVKEVTGRMAAMTTPLAMIYLGLLISTTLTNVRQVLSPRLIPPMVGKLLVFPAMAALLIAALQVPVEMASVILVSAATPMATTVAIVFAKSGADESFALVTTLVGTLVSLVTIPIVLYAGGFWIL